MPGPARLERLGEARLYLVATVPAPDRGTTDDLFALVAAAVEGGVDVVQLRLKHGDAAGRRRALRDLRRVLGPAPLLIVNDDADALLDTDGRPLADGLHVGREDAASHAPRASDLAVLPTSATPSAAAAEPRDVAAGLTALRARLGPHLLLGTSTRTVEEIARAVAAGADHVGFGAMARSSTKDDTSPASTAELQRAVRRFPDLPVFPIGGLGPGNLALVTAAGCHRAAIGSAILDAGRDGVVDGLRDGVRDAARRCRALLEPVTTPPCGTDVPPA